MLPRLQIQLLLPLLAALVLASAPEVAEAGADCGPRQGWKLLGKLAKGTTTAKQLGPGNNDVDLCLLGPKALRPGQRNWYRKGPKRQSAEMSAQGKRIASLCEPAFAGAKRKLAKELCVGLLAEEGVSQIARQSTLTLGTEVFACGFPLRQLRRLPGPKSARAAEAQWLSEQKTFCGFGGCRCSRAPKAKPSRARMRYRAKFLRDHKVDVLNALSWIGDAKTITWLEDVAIKDDDAHVRKRALTVLDVLRADD